jgi:maltose-binding protein MalE
VLSACISAATYDGKLYAYLVASETYALFYNKDLCPNPPKTWDELASFDAGFNGSDKYGFVMDLTSGY